MREMEEEQMDTARMSKRARLDFVPMIFLYALLLRLLPEKIDITCIAGIHCRNKPKGRPREQIMYIVQK